MSETTVKFREFEENEDLITFTVGSDTFQAAPALPIALMQDLVDLINGFKDKDETTGKSTIGAQVETLKEVFKVVLLDESYDPFVARLSSKTKPLSLKTVMDILNWLLEVYGLRPTTPSEDSLTSSQSEGGTSTLPDGAQVMGLSPSN